MTEGVAHMASWNDDLRPNGRETIGKPVSDVRNIKPLTWVALIAAGLFSWWVIINALEGLWRLVVAAFGG